MRVLIIGGTGNISAAVSRRAVAAGHELHLLHRGQRGEGVVGARSLRADINDACAVEAALGSLTFDAVVDFVAFVPEHVERDRALFSRRTKQYVFISSASAYEKPPRSHLITESTPLKNPYWEYSRNKIACEEYLMRAYRDEGFPATIVRPSLTYDTVLPIAMGGWGCATLLDRLLAGRPIIVHGDGTSLWTVTHADDFAKGFVPLLGNPRSIGQSYHITSDEVLTWNQIYETIADALGVTAELVHLPSDFIAEIEPAMAGGLLGDKAHSAVFDNSKIRREVPDFVATVPFHVGIRRTIEWFRADPARWVVRSEVNAALDRLLAHWQRVRSEV